MSTASKLKPIGIAIYNCLAAHANQEGFCFPSHKHIANKIGASISSVQRGIRQLIKLESRSQGPTTLSQSVLPLKTR